MVLILLVLLLDAHISWSNCASLYTDCPKEVNSLLHSEQEAPHFIFILSQSERNEVFLLHFTCDFIWLCNFLKMSKVFHICCAALFDEHMIARQLYFESGSRPEVTVSLGVEPVTRTGGVAACFYWQQFTTHRCCLTLSHIMHHVLSFKKRVSHTIICKHSHMLPCWFAMTSLWLHCFVHCWSNWWKSYLRFR